MTSEQRSRQPFSESFTQADNSTTRRYGGIGLGSPSANASCKPHGRGNPCEEHAGAWQRLCLCRRSSGTAVLNAACSPSHPLHGERISLLMTMSSLEHPQRYAPYRLDPSGERGRPWLCCDAARGGAAASPDWLMPGMSGKDTAQALCAALPKQPVILFLATIHGPNVLAHIREGKTFPMRLIKAGYALPPSSRHRLRPSSRRLRPDRAVRRPLPRTYGRAGAAGGGQRHQPAGRQRNPAIQRCAWSPPGTASKQWKTLGRRRYDAVLMDIRDARHGWAEKPPGSLRGIRPVRQTCPSSP